MGSRFLAGIVAAFALAGVLPHLAFAAPIAPVESFTLANGLEVIVITNRRIPAVSQMLWYKVGGSDDPQGKSGIAHFHEHVMFLGTKRYPKGEFSAIASSHGGDDNAFTSHDATAYFINVPKDKLALVMDLESDRMQGLNPDDATIEKERQVIIEERRMRTENNPDALLNEQMEAALFRNHPYGRPVIGWMHEMEGLSKQDVLDFHKKWYTPSNAILIISGDVTAKEVKPLAEKYYGRFPKVAAPKREWNAEPPQNVARHLVMHHANVKQPQWGRTYAVASVAYGKKEQALPLFILAEILGDGKTSRLYQSLVVEQKLASGVNVGYNGFTIGPASFDISITPENGVDLAALEKALDKELAKTLSNPFTEAELTRAKTLLKAETIFARDGLTSMSRIMGMIRMCGLKTEYFDQWPAMIEAITPQQVADAAKESLQITGSVTAHLLPEGEP